MDIKGNQKEEYINQYRKSLFDTTKEFFGSITATQTTKIEQLVTARREKIADDFEFGIDVGNLITHTIFPLDIVRVENSNNIASGFYYLAEVNKKQKLYSIN